MPASSCPDNAAVDTASRAASGQDEQRRSLSSLARGELSDTGSRRGQVPAFPDADWVIPIGAMDHLIRWNPFLLVQSSACGGIPTIC
jgi:hypothetical protein